MHYDVAIIGLGPVGAALANLLGGFGARTLVLEREAEIYDLPRAVHFDDEVMRIFQSIGIADEVTAVSRINPGMRFVDAAGKLLLDWPRPPGIGPNGWNSSYRFHQPDLERILRTALAWFDHVDVRTGTECTAISDDGDKVTIRYRNGPAEDTATAAYVVGCDGARSFVRERIACDLEDLGFRERWLVVDVLLKHPRPDLGDHSIQFCDPSRPATYVRCPGNRRRWELSLHDDEDTSSITSPDMVWALLSKWLHRDEAELERAVVYEFGSVIARKWRNDRLLIAGDSAHLTPPFMGQGMCAGIRDASNLAWKLHWHLARGADDRLLDTYASERIPHVREYIETAVRLGRLINTSETEAALRAALPQADGSARMASISPRLGPGLGSKGDPLAGRLCPQPHLADGTRLDDACGSRFALLVDEAMKMENLPGSLTVLSASSHPQIGQCLVQLGTRAILIRPDRYILGTATTPEGLQNLLRQAPLN